MPRALREHARIRNLHFQPSPTEGTPCPVPCTHTSLPPCGLTHACHAWFRTTAVHMARGSQAGGWMPVAAAAPCNDVDGRLQQVRLL